MSLPASASVIGLIAGTLTTIAFVPQVVKAWQTRSLADFSLPMLVLFTLGVALWVAYGVLTSAPPVIIANVVTLAMSIALVVMKIRFG